MNTVIYFQFKFQVKCFGLLGYCEKAEKCGLSILNLCAEKRIIIRVAAIKMKLLAGILNERIRTDLFPVSFHATVIINFPLSFSRRGMNNVILVAVALQAVHLPEMSALVNMHQGHLQVRRNLAANVHVIQPVDGYVTRGLQHRTERSLWEDVELANGKGRVGSVGVLRQCEKPFFFRQAFNNFIVQKVADNRILREKDVFY